MPIDRLAVFAEPLLQHDEGPNLLRDVPSAGTELRDQRVDGLWSEQPARLDLLPREVAVDETRELPSQPHPDRRVETHLRLGQRSLRKPGGQRIAKDCLRPASLQLGASGKRERVLDETVIAIRRPDLEPVRHANAVAVLEYVVRQIRLKLDKAEPVHGVARRRAVEQVLEETLWRR